MGCRGRDGRVGMEDEGRGCVGCAGGTGECGPMGMVMVAAVRFRSGDGSRGIIG